MSTANSDSDIRQLTVRLPRAVYARAQRAARARKTSLSALVRKLLEDLERAEREAELARAYELLGEDADVEPQFKAQAEVARRG
jgi:macrodomain Ter protein organizer (MatP/YcbG family)